MSATRLTTDELPPGCDLEVWGDNTVWVTVPEALLSIPIGAYEGDRLDGRRRLPLRDFLRWRVT